MRADATEIDVSAVSLKTSNRCNSWLTSTSSGVRAPRDRCRQPAPSARNDAKTSTFKSKCSLVDSHVHVSTDLPHDVGKFRIVLIVCTTAVIFECVHDCAATSIDAGAVVEGGNSSFIICIEQL